MKLMQTGSPQCPHCGKRITPFKKPLRNQRWMNGIWLLLAATSFALSFVFHRYYMQFLIVTVLVAVKWILERRATKTQIMIYRALQEEAEPSLLEKVRSTES